MYIKKITLENFRIYNGQNELVFPQNSNKNVFIISGNNGFGKTTLLTSLVWCLYGKLMVDVDDKFRREIYESGGYKKFAASNLNRLAKANNQKKYRVTVVLGDVFIPSLPCNEVTISRSFTQNASEDEVVISIDGLENELTKRVGDEIFINDFILPKEVAKFFFFDAEKIVSLAEIKSIDEKRSLSKAYSEVLGIKKYEDLKNHLEDLRIRFRRNSATEKDRKRLEELQKEITQHRKLVNEYEGQLANLHEERLSKKQSSDQYQEKLIREGNAMSVDELTDLKKVRNQLTEKAEAIKSKLKELLELAPFAIAGNKLAQVKQQLTDEIEVAQNTFNPALVKRKAKQVHADLLGHKKELKLTAKQVKQLEKIITETIVDRFGSKGRNKKGFKVLLDFSDTEKNEFDAIYTNLKNAFSLAFRQLVTDYKNNRIFFNKVIRKISDAESKENDLLIKEIRQQKEQLDKKIEEIEQEMQNLHQHIGGQQREIAIKAKLVSELAKKVDLETTDQAKDETAGRLIKKLNTFITKLKNEKKDALEKRLKEELNNLMHKTAFISDVKVDVGDDIIDINLYNRRGEQINKEVLSKGEQQLYATALLKALVDESNIKFSVFIDSPLQKFDKTHSRNIIFSFYPKISEQVVLFPLLEKELTEAEYESLLPKINRVYLIENLDEDSSRFIETEPSKLFETYKQNKKHVYAH